MELRAQIETEQALKNGQLGLRLRLFHLPKNKLADGSRAQSIEIDMDHPNGIRRQIGPLQWTGQGSEAAHQEAASAKSSFQVFQVHKLFLDSGFFFNESISAPFQ